MSESKTPSTYSFFRGLPLYKLLRLYKIFFVESTIVKTNYANVKIVLNSVENKNKIEQRKINPDGKFEFERVMPGNYLLWIFEDSDSNNHYSFGNVDSNKFAETFKFYPDTLDLRPRWPIGDIEIDFNK